VADVVDDLVARRVLTLDGGPRPLPGLTPPPPREIREPVPVGLLAELTYRCPLRCPYCSNPVDLDAYAGELTTSQWTRALDQARALGVLQVHLSGGEPLLRPDLVDLVAHARGLGQYTNLITSGIPLGEERLAALVGAGLDHVQLSIQDAVRESGDAIAGIRAHDRKVEVAALIRASGLPLTVNVVLHAGNVDRIGAIARFAAGLGANRIELAHTQYYGWGLRNRAALLPTADQVARANEAVAGLRLDPAIELVYVAADYHGDRPKPCMQGWGSRQLVIAPNGDALPCLAAGSLPGLELPNVRDRSLEEIWYASAAFAAYRGTAWMREPCRTCEWREVDHGGCRCQAYALVGDAAATDPVCGLSPHHDPRRPPGRGRPGPSTPDPRAGRGDRPLPRDRRRWGNSTVELRVPGLRNRARGPARTGPRTAWRSAATVRPGTW
jgi:pyrroloquinoline quinone biosynthesis protein E